MRKVVLTLAALAAFGIALPAATIGSANAETIIIKKKHRDHGWRHHHHRDRVVIKEKHRHHHRGNTVGVVVR
jgi:hypothetical protein